MHSRQYYNHTQAVMDRFSDMADNGIKMIWSELGNKFECVTSGKWKKHYEEIVSRYNISSRFALMRILFEKATGVDLLKATSDVLEKGFYVDGFGAFTDISIKHAEKLTEQEISLYKELLMQRVKEFNPNKLEEASRLVDAAMDIAENGKKTCLERDEILQLGHLLDFSLVEMEFYLLRVLGDNEKGLSFSSSNDLIDMYGYLTHSKLVDVEELKSWYSAEVKERKIKKKSYDEKADNWTQEIGNSFQDMVVGWDESDHQLKMKEWLIKQAPYLDMRSKTALRVYRNLAVYAYCLTRPDEYGADVISESNDFYSEIDEFSSLLLEHTCTRDLLYANDEVSKEKCENLSDAIMLANRDLAKGEKLKSSNEDSTLSYHIIHLDNGKISVRGEINKGYRNSRKRLADILRGKIDPNKGDMLFLLWFIANYWWTDYTDDFKVKAGRLSDFIDSAQCMLKNAILPDFYPVNVLEDAMMNSIILEDYGKSPSRIYEEICESFTQKGVAKKKKNTKTHTDDEKIKIVEYYLSKKEQGYTVKKCAEEFGVGESSVTNWMNAYRLGKLYSSSKKIEIVEDYFSKTKEGYTIEKYIIDLELEASSLKKWIKEYQTGKFHSNNMKIKTVEQWLKMEKDGFSLKECAEFHNIEKSALKKWIKSYQEGNLKKN